MMNAQNLVKYKLWLGAALAGVTAVMGALGYGTQAHDIAIIGAALLGALGLNAVGQGLSSGSNSAPVAQLKEVGK